MQEQKNELRGDSRMASLDPGTLSRKVSNYEHLFLNLDVQLSGPGAGTSLRNLRWRNHGLVPHPVSGSFPGS